MKEVDNSGLDSHVEQDHLDVRPDVFEPEHSNASKPEGIGIVHYYFTAPPLQKF